MRAKEKTISSYTILNNWFYDGSKETTIPDEVIKDKSIGQMYLLNFFKSSAYGMVISKLFNNWGLFELDRIEVLKFMKECILLSGFKQPFFQRVPPKKSKLVDEFKSKYPFLKKEELFMIVDIVDNSEEKEQVYEMFGLYTPTKKKLTKEQKESFNTENKKEKVSLDSLMESFE